MRELRGRLAGTSIERQHFGLVLEKLLSVLDDSPRDAVEVLNFVGFQIVEYLFQTLDESVSRLPGEHVGGAQLRDNLGI